MADPDGDIILLSRRKYRDGWKCPQMRVFSFGDLHSALESANANIRAGYTVSVIGSRRTEFFQEFFYTLIADVVISEKQRKPFKYEKEIQDVGGNEDE